MSPPRFPQQRNFEYEKSYSPADGCSSVNACCGKPRHAARLVRLNGVTIFDRNASGRARVTTAKKSGRWGRAGKLEWVMQDIQSIDGTRVPARFTKRELGDSKGGTVAVAAVATTVLLGPLGLLWGLKKGQQAIIPAGNRYNVFVHGDTTLKGRAAANTP